MTDVIRYDKLVRDKISRQGIAKGRRIIAAPTSSAHQVITAATHDIIAAEALLRPFPVVARQVIDVVGFGFLPDAGTVSSCSCGKGIVGVIAPGGAVARDILPCSGAGLDQPLQGGVPVDSELGQPL